jgi:hypothetical protein
MKWVGHVACMGEMRNMYKILVGKPKGNRLFEDLGMWKISERISKFQPIKAA